MDKTAFLTGEELQDLTGRVRLHLQRQWLDAHGWTYTVNANGRPIVSRAHMENMLGGARAEAARTERRRPNFDAIA